jgi:hypothetical protein
MTLGCAVPVNNFRFAELAGLPWIAGSAVTRVTSALSRCRAWLSLRNYRRSSKSPSFTPSRKAPISAWLKISTGPCGYREFRTATS